MSDEQSIQPTNFIRAIVDADVRSNKHDGKVVTRFPPEPNGYLHIGHAKSICLNFGIAADYNGLCALRFDDTNPEKESKEYESAIQTDVRWLGFDWGERLRHASGYFDQLYEFALELINNEQAYVCSLSAEEIRAYRGTLTEPGKNSPYRARSVSENLALFESMNRGEFEDGAHVLRAKIDMASPNINLRDPTLYRIRRAHHHRTGDKWNIYPMYDFAHGLSDAIEGVTHSLCTLEFEDHRPLYDWLLEHTSAPARPHQYEFARLNLTYTVLSKRKLSQLVSDGHVLGWDDPRMPTLTGLRRRGFPPTAIREFCNQIGVTKKDSVVDVGQLESQVRDELDKSSSRVMAVLNPLRVVIDNYPEDLVEQMEATNHPNDPELGTRLVPFSRELYIERDDFLEDPPKKFFRLAPGREVRLRYGYLITCETVIKDPATGEITELRCRYDPETRGGSTPDGRKVKGTLHWVSAHQAISAEIRLYDRLFSEPHPDSNKDGREFTDFLNPNSVQVLPHCLLEPSLATAQAADTFQFERLGYFCVDRESTLQHLIFNRTLTLRDTWAKIRSK